MPKPTVQNLAKQIGRISEEAIKETASAPGAIAGKVLEQMGAGSANPPTGGQKTNPTQAQKQNELVQKAQEDRVKSEIQANQVRDRLKEIEQEMKKLRLLREEQLRQRHSSFAEASVDKQEVVEAPLVEPQTKQPKGMFAGLRSRKQQSQPELAGKRVGG